MIRKAYIIALLLMAAVTANAQFLFRVSGNELEKPSYILGSIHVLSGTLLDSIPAFLEAENQCLQLYVETNVKDEHSKKVLQESGQQILALPDSMTIYDVIGDENKPLLNKKMKEVCHVDLADSTASQYLHYYPSFYTMLLNMMVQFGALQKYPALRNGNMMDVVCIQRAKDREWNIGELDQPQKPEELEKTKENYAQSMKEQTDSLLALLNNFNERVDNMVKQFEGALTMCDYWKTGDYESFEAFLQKDVESNPSIYGDRNKKWLPTITAAMKERPTLFVFGSGHLPGPQGVVNLLREAGYTVEQVK